MSRFLLAVFFFFYTATNICSCKRATLRLCNCHRPLFKLQICYEFCCFKGLFVAAKLLDFLQLQNFAATFFLLFFFFLFVCFVFFVFCFVLFFVFVLFYCCFVFLFFVLFLRLHMRCALKSFFFLFFFFFCNCNSLEV